MPVRQIAPYGWKPDLPDIRDRSFNLERSVFMPHQLAASHSLRDEMPGVYDQGHLGSCTANAIGSLLEHAAMRQGQPPVTPSRLFLYYEERAIEGTTDSDSGAQIRDGIKVAASEGVPPESAWGYDITRFAETPPKSVYDEARKHEAIEYLSIILGGRGAPVRTALLQEPVVFGFPVPDYFETWDATAEPLAVPDESTNYIGGHAVALVGWDWTRRRFNVPVLEVRNSWGPSFGDSGYFWMDANWFNSSLGLVSDLWTISKVTG